MALQQQQNFMLLLIAGVEVNEQLSGKINANITYSNKITHYVVHTRPEQHVKQPAFGESNSFVCQSRNIYIDESSALYVYAYIFNFYFNIYAHTYNILYTNNLAEVRKKVVKIYSTIHIKNTTNTKLLNVVVKRNKYDYKNNNNIKWHFI